MSSTDSSGATGAATATSAGAVTAAGGSPPTRRQDRGSRSTLRILAVGLSVLLVGWLAFNAASLLARVSEQHSATYTGISSLDLHVGFESVQIVGADTTTVSMQRSYKWSLGKPRIGNQRSGGVLSITSSCPFSVGRGCSGRIRLVVPRGLEIRARTSDGGLEVRDLDGSMDLSSSDGGIQATNVTGRLTMRSSDGSIDATRLRSDEVDVRSSDGSTRLGFETAPSLVTGRSSDGSIEIVVPHDGTAYDVTTTTSDGGKVVAVPTSSRSSHRMELHTSDGSIRVVDRT